MMFFTKAKCGVSSQKEWSTAVALLSCVSAFAHTVFSTYTFLLTLLSTSLLHVPDFTFYAQHLV